MAKANILRAGSTAENQEFTGAENEIVGDEGKNTVVYHDGQKKGGYPLAKKEEVDALSQEVDTKLDSETDTTLDLQGGKLIYINESGVRKEIPLSEYIDDTNLARLVSGTVAANGVATFKRDDDTEFTIDMSVFLDDTKLSDAEIKAMGYIKAEDVASFDLDGNHLTITLP